MLILLTQALAFIVTIALVVATARHLAFVYTRTIGILGAAVVGLLLSVIADFTMAYSVDGYDRSIEAMVERAAMGGALAMIVGYLVLRPSSKKSN